MVYAFVNRFGVVIDEFCEVLIDLGLVRGGGLRSLNTELKKVSILISVSKEQSRAISAVVKMLFQ